MTENTHLTQDDEISLTEIYETLRASWKPIVGLSALGTGLGISLALALPKTYEASAYLEPPLAAQYMVANEGRTPLTGLSWISGDQLYSQFLTQLNSDAAKYEFFEKTYLPSLDKQPENALAKNALFSAKINKLVLVKEPVPKKGRQLYNITIQAPTSTLAMQWMDDYLNQAQEAARTRWASEAQKEIDITIKNTEKDITEKLTLAKKLREDRETRLKEALQVAQSVGQQSPQFTTGQLPKQDSITSFADGSALYARGTRSLSAEIDVLRAREDETAFVDGLREAQAKLQALQTINLANPSIGMYRVDGQVLEPAQPISPKKSLLTIIGLFLGLFTGVIWAFVKQAMRPK